MWRLGRGQHSIHDGAGTEGFSKISNSGRVGLPLREQSATGTYHTLLLQLQHPREDIVS